MRNTLGRGLRFAGPIALAVLLITGPPLGPSRVEAVTGSGFVWLAGVVAALLLWPRLWVLAPNLVVWRLAVGFGAVAWVDLVENVATIFMALPLILIGITSAWRRLPAATPGAPGTIVPNADGIGSLLALPVVLFLASTDRWPILFGLAAAFAFIRLVDYGRKHQLAARGRGWVAFMGGLWGMTLYCFYWSRPDAELGRALAAAGGPMVGVILWAIQRAILPYHNRATTP